MSALFPLTLRLATPDDAKRLVEVGVASYLDFLSDLPGFAQAPRTVPAAVENWVGEDAANIVLAEHDGAILGWSKIEPATGEIEDLWVEPQHQRSGVGAMLLMAAEVQARAAGHSSTWLNSHAEKSATLRFYRVHGYALLSVRQVEADSVPSVMYNQALLGKQLSRPNAAKAETMSEVRKGIDTLDPMIVSLLSERFAFIDRAADLKPALAMPARVSERVEEVVINARTQAEQLGFDPVLTEKLWRTMVDLAIEREEHSFELNRQKDAS